MVRSIFLLAPLFFSTANSFAGAPSFDVFPARAAKKSSSPILIFVHGGAWISGNKSDLAGLAKSFSEAGLCVVLPNYGLAPRSVHPRPVQQLNEVLQAAPKAFAKGKCDPKRIYLAGHSAGAHMIASWNTLFRNPAVKGFIGVEGIYDLPNLAERWPTYPDWFLKKAFGPLENWGKASPSRLKPLGKAPWLLIHSTADELVDAGQSETFAKHLRAEKITVKGFYPEVGTHDEMVKHFGEAGAKSTQEAMQFISP